MKLKFLSLSLALVLLLTVAAGCGSKAPDPAEPTPPSATETPSADPDPEADAAAAERHAKYARAYEAYSPDTVVLRVNGQPVLWSEFFSWVYSIAPQMEDYFGITDWSADFPGFVTASGDSSCNAYVHSYAVTSSVQLAIILQKAAELGADLSEEQQASLEETFAHFRDEEDFADVLNEYFITEEYLRTQYEATTLYDNLYTKLFGDDGADCPEEDVLQYIVDQGYLYAKHILFTTVDDNRQPLDEDTVAQKRADAEAVLAQLKACPVEERAQLFDRLLDQYGEDPGMRSRPDGYYFLPGTMVPEFEEAAKALEQDQVSEIVETSYGYHILFRPAMSADHLMDYDDQYYQPYTVRSFVSAALFSNMTYDWYDAAEVEFTPGFETLDLNALLAG